MVGVFILMGSLLILAILVIPFEYCAVARSDKKKVAVDEAHISGFISNGNFFCAVKFLRIKNKLNRKRTTKIYVFVRHNKCDVSFKQ